MKRGDHYPIEVYWSEEDEIWVATIPDFRYCTALGDTPEEAVAEVLVAKAAWLESAREGGVPLPEPSPRLATIT